MFQIPDYTINVSFRLCEVFDEIGVNPRILQKRRTSWLLKESIHMLTNQLEDDNSSVYYFGSQTESTTTIGLDSDCECLLTFNDFNVIQDQRDREHGYKNLLMIQDENVSPGYCLLQHLGDGVLHPHDELNEYHFRDKMGRMVLKNTVFTGAAGTGAIRHGRAYSEHGRPGIYNTDLVYALPCRSWPIQATNWLGPYKTRQWPSDAMQKYCSSTGCFAVAVGSNNSEKEEFEWRISTSLAERSLIFSLNISQIRCYILMKMILKTFICPKTNDVISSFMCKTVLLHCIANTHANTWREHNLLSCLTFCLSSLYYCVLNENCPHFIIPENNLMAGKLSAESKSFIVRVLLELVNSNGRAMLQIHCDRLGFILQNKFSVVTVSGEPKNFLSKQISGQLSKEVALHINDGVKDLLSQINGSDDMQAVSQIISK
ncbi:uncharacterized protein LOC123550783 [Mercenaria mercenaria]|uniref:uncharacterized protein LOC123550783 n=1 Tax=Mercenaria mercenaria TaxID=6596 RepID=UPI00234F8686|nr:uncharacterized protein LOC123550783 [Mercenaria mercenaria]